MMIGGIRGFMLWLSGLTIGIFLMVGDELISLSLYCGEKCQYPYPLIGTFPIWKAWEIAFGGILAGVLLGLAAVWEGNGMADKKPFKMIIVTADFEPEPGVTVSNQADREKARIVNAILRGDIKPATDSPVECYCDTCKQCFAGTWFDHQRIVHNRNLPVIPKPFHRILFDFVRSKLGR